jgi:predicted amidohydrolase YtcJ
MPATNSLRTAAVTLITAATTFLPLAPRAAEQSPATPADTILRHGLVYTVDAHDRIAQAIAIKDGRILYVGTDAGVRQYIGPGTQLIDLAGRMLMPGLIDGHMHPLSGGGQLMTCNLDYAPLTVPQFQQRIQACLDTGKDKEPAGLLRVTGWYRQFMRPAGADADAATLDALGTERPVIVESTDGHTLVANTRAMALAGVSATTPEPADGHIGRDAAGKATGVFEDGGQRALAGAVPASSPEENVAMAQAALDALRHQGVTTFLDAAAAPDSLAAFAAVAKAGGLTARAHFAPVIEAQAAGQPGAVVDALKAAIAQYDGGAIVAQPGITVRNAKIFMDGVLQAPAQTAVLLAPYRIDTGKPGHPRWVPGTRTGEPYFAQDVLNPMLVALAEAGIDPHIHAIGDRAVHQALDGIEVMRHAVPGADVRAAIAHAEMVDPADYARFARLDAIPVMSFQWAKPGPDSIDAARDYLGPVRFERMEPEGSLYAAHARIAYGSDWPVDRLDEWFALKVGITRTGDPALGAKYAGRLNAQNDLPRAFALRAITMNAAYELHQDEVTGSLEAGKLADLIVLDRHVLAVPAAQIAQTRVLLTMVGGRIVYRAEGF